MTYGLCPACKEMRYLTRHHLFPKRFFHKQKRPPTLFLCRECHNELERSIPYNEKLYKRDYLQIARAFLIKKQSHIGGVENERNRNANDRTFRNGSKANR